MKQKSKRMICYWDIAEIVTLPPFNAFGHFDVIFDIIYKKAPKPSKFLELIKNKIDRHFNPLWTETKNIVIYTLSWWYCWHCCPTPDKEDKLDITWITLSSFFLWFSFFRMNIFWSSNYIKYKFNQKGGEYSFFFKIQGKNVLILLTKSWQIDCIFNYMLDRTKTVVFCKLTLKQKNWTCLFFYSETKQHILKKKVLLVIEILHIL